MWRQWTLMRDKASLTRQSMPKAWLRSSWRTMQASVSDGLQSQDIVELCGLGPFGAYPNNCHRDLLRHGDGVEFSTDILLTFSWGPSLFTVQGLKESEEQNASHSMDSSFLVTAWPKSATDSKTWDAIHAVMAWSLGALQPCSMASIQKLIGKETHCHPIWQGLHKSHLQSKAIHFGFSISSVTWNIMQTALIFRIGAHTSFVGFATATKQIPTRTHMISLTALDASLQVLKA